MKSSLPPTNLGALTGEQLDQNLRSLKRESSKRKEGSNELQQLVQELEMHRIELEMQNRALREVQEELEHSVQRYADLYENLPLPYFTITQTGKIVTVNRAATEFFCSDSRGLVGRLVGSFLDPYDAGRFAAHLEYCVESQKPAVTDLTVRTGNGRNVVVQVSTRLAPQLSAAEPQFLIAFTDISKLKQAQRYLEEINREQEAFNYSISHDLRAPLVTIENYAGIVLSDHAKALSDEGRNMVQRIQCAAQRMEATLKQLLEYSTVAHEEVVLQPVSLETIISNLMIEHRSCIQETKAEIVVERPLPMVIGAPMILNQMFSNLLSNALKYTRPTEAPRVRISAETVNSHVIVKVADEGIGIDRKYHDRIFRVFERLHGYSKYPGSGVGLAIAQRAAERLNGRIWVESEPEKGSAFYVKLPKS